MGRAPREITEYEQFLLKELWQRQLATVHQLAEAIYSDTTPAKLSTVRKLLDRLEVERCVSCDRRNRPYQYCAVLKREELARNRLQAIADELFNGDMNALLTCFVRRF
jgi:predicted transcriptional regulator